MQRQKKYLVIASFLAILSILVISYQKGAFCKSMDSKKISTIFAIKDTSVVTKIFIADMFGEKVLLAKTKEGWMVDYSKQASPLKIKDLLVTIAAIRVAQPIAKPAQRSIIEMLAVSSTKVEIYETKPLFKLFGYHCFNKERLAKTYYLGDATQNNLGSFASIEGMPDPYIVYKPGFRGYITPQFSPKSIDWYSKRIFSTKLTHIQKASFLDIKNTENSFCVEKTGTRTFALFDFQNNVVSDYDTTRIINMLSEFREKYYEMYLPNISNSLKDSILSLYCFKVVSVTDINNQTTTMKVYYLFNTGSLYEDDELIDNSYAEINKDRCYATFNEDTSEIYTVQLFQFERQFQPFSYFFKK
ncbi:MAG: DUF4340 domain-containing protein [Lentimicrobiaceae bacterium]|nr:DUF4340 domain-containing protein [Lentimicrobiaceae bacterium]